MIVRGFSSLCLHRLDEVTLIVETGNRHGVALSGALPSRYSVISRDSTCRPAGSTLLARLLKLRQLDEDLISLSSGCHTK